MYMYILYIKYMYNLIFLLYYYTSRTVWSALYGYCYCIRKRIRCDGMLQSSFRLLTLYENSKTIFVSIMLEVNFTECRQSNRTLKREERSSERQASHNSVSIYRSIAGHEAKKIVGRTSRQNATRRDYATIFARALIRRTNQLFRIAIESGRSEFLSSVRNCRDGKLFFRDSPYVAVRYVAITAAADGTLSISSGIQRASSVDWGIHVVQQSARRENAKWKKLEPEFGAGTNEIFNWKKRRARQENAILNFFLPLSSTYPGRRSRSFLIPNFRCRTAVHTWKTRYDRRKETFNIGEKFTLSGEISVPARAHRDDAQDRSLPVFIRATVGVVRATASHRTDISTTSTP